MGALPVRWRIAVSEAPVFAAIALAGWWVLGHPATPLPEVADRLAQAIGWLVVPGLCIAAGIILTAAMRFSDDQILDGQASNVPDRLEILLRYNRNTLEQAVLVVIAWPAFALAVPTFAPVLLPILAGFFATGRLAFLIGYMIAPWARGVGFGLTFYPTALIYGWLIFGA